MIGLKSKQGDPKLTSSGSKVILAKSVAFKHSPTECVAVLCHLHNITKRAYNDDVEIEEFGRFIRVAAVTELPQNIGTALVDRHISVAVISVWHCTSQACAHLKLEQPPIFPPSRLLFRGVALSSFTHPH